MTDWSNSPFNAGTIMKEWSDLIVRLTGGAKSVLDLGCGSGRFSHLFQGLDYLGVDINQHNIDQAKKNRPGQKFECADITRWDTDKKYDLVFSWVSLQHIDPLYFDELAEKINRWGKHVLLCEHVEDPEELDNGYLWRHDYARHFNITFTEPIVDKVKVMYGTTKVFVGGKTGGKK